MAKRKNTGRVPVASRDNAPQRTSARRLPLKLSPVGVIALVAVALMILLTIAIPLRNFFQQRSDIARVEASIAAKEQQREELLEGLDRYSSEEYIRQQARLRLGVIEPGETAFRILDPAMEQNDTLTSTDEDVQNTGPWYTTLWDSISRPEALENPVVDETPEESSGDSGDNGTEGVEEVPENAEPPVEQPAQ